MSKNINMYEHMNTILSALKKGILLTTSNGTKNNSMTISWGQIGIEWNKPIFTTYVRTGRYTYQLLNENPEFTINIPLPGMDISKYIKICGTQTGKDVDKHAQAEITTVPSPSVSVPGIKELPLTLECKVVYRQLQDKSAIPAEVKPTFYPDNVPSSDCGSNKDYHEMFYGEIVGAYIAE